MNSYKVLNDIEHVIKCREMYIGNSGNSEENMFLYDYKTNKLTFSKCMFNYCFLKMFDEILTNAVDNYVRTKKTSYIKININDESLTVENDGPSIPIIKHETYTDLYIPEVIFTKLRSSSNYDDKERITGGLNGIGAKLTSIFSKRFEVDICDGKKSFYQMITNNCSNINKPIVKASKTMSHVRITYVPDWEKVDETKTFSNINETLKQLISYRCFSLTYLPIDIIINDTKIPRLTLKDFSTLHFKLFDENMSTFEFNNNLWMISFGFTHEKPCVISWVNNVSTIDNGAHVDNIRKQIATFVRAKTKNKTLSLKTIYSKLSMCVIATIPNAKYTSQSKTKLSVGKYDIPTLPLSLIERFVNETDIVDFLNNGKVKRENTKTQRTRITNIDKLLDAEDACIPLAKRKNKNICSLFICEGDSAQSLCIRGIKYLGERSYGSFALRGKVLNTQKATEKRYLENVELTNLKRAIGLVEGKKYTNTDELRYQRIICCKDADFDGSLIMGLLVNFFYQYFKELMELDGFFCEFVTPVINIYKEPYVPKSSYPLRMFYNLNVFNDERANIKERFKCKYIKGLGGNSDNDIETYFKDFDKNVVKIDCKDSEQYIKLIYTNEKGYTNKRKTWISETDINAYLPRDKPSIKFEDICKVDIGQAANDTCERSISSVVDGLKPSQRKVLYTFFNMPEKQAKTPMKVFQLTGKVSDFAAYHHGNQSLDDVIIRMAQDFVGANNLNLLERDGQFGTRNKLGNDASASRYISTYLSDISRLIFPKEDDRLLTRRLEDNELVEPFCYVPIIPMLLVNGSCGIGTGWSTNIPMFSPFALIDKIRNKLVRKDNVVLFPWYKNYMGKIYDSKDSWVFIGNVERLDEFTYIVDEIPINMSIQTLRDKMNELQETKILKQYSNILKATDKTKDKDAFKFKLSFESNVEINDVFDVIKMLDLKTSISKKNLVAYDVDNHVKLYKNIDEIFNEWFNYRRSFYEKRYELLLNDLYLELNILINKQRFINKINNKTYKIMKMSKVKIVELLEREKYIKVDNSFEYLLRIPIYNLSLDKLKKLEQKINDVKTQIETMKNTTIETLWLNDLDVLEKYMKQ